MIPGSANPLLLASAAEAGAYQIERSLRFNSSDSAYLSRTPASAGNRKTWTWAGWVKRGLLNDTTTYQQLFSAGTTNTVRDVFFFDTDVDDTLAFYSIGGLYGGTLAFRTNAVFRDPSAWYHIVLVLDTPNATSTDRFRLYVNGLRQTFSTYAAPTQNADSLLNSNTNHAIGRDEGNDNQYLNGYLADIHFIDGQALDPTSFGEFDTNGIWQPKAYTGGSYGTNGFHLDFSDNSTAAALGTDTSGNGNTWTVHNLSNVTGGPTSVDAASGALPIYNTTDTYGGTKGSGTRTDANASSLVLAIPMDGANNGTTFTDESATIKGSGSAKTISRFGDTKTSTAQSKYYGSSGYFDGNGDYLEINTSSDFNFGSGSFCVEFWVNFSATPASFIALVAGTTANTQLFITTKSNGQGLRFGLTGVAQYATGTQSWSTGVWYHVALVRNSSDIKFYVNGINVTDSSFTNSTSYSGGFLLCGNVAATTNLTGYLQDLRIYNGVPKYTSNFNPPSSTQNATVAAGNDSLVDTPTNGSQTDTGVGGEVVGNYATLNPLVAPHTYSNGNLDFTFSTAGNTSILPIQASITMEYGKWYAEVLVGSGATGIFIGIWNADNFTKNYVGSTSDSYSYWSNTGNKYNNASNSAYGSSFTAGDLIGVAFDADAGTLTFYKNGVSQGVAFSGITARRYVFAAHKGALGSDTRSAVWNFGQRPFAYTAPSGFKALCTTNLDDPLVAKPSTVMDVKLYTGNGGTQTISGLEFSPDFLWIKMRSSTQSHRLFDQIRGVSSTLFSNLAQAENTTFTELTSFNSDGFTVQFNGGQNGTNENNRTYVAWCWDAGDSTVTNTDGSITSQVRANQTAGFSIVTWTGNGTVGHGLGVAPVLYIWKRRNLANNWGFNFTFLDGSLDYMYLNLTNAKGDATQAAPTSTVITIPSGDMSGTDTGVLYAFAPVDGYSNGFSYTGNGSADGSFVYLGFRPKLLLIKRSDSTAEWKLLDTVRSSGGNVVDDILYPDGSYTEGSNDGNHAYDFLSNGFKVRATHPVTNASGGTYIGFAWAENPFQYARAR